MLIFGCAQDDTQRVEQEGVCACTRVPRRDCARDHKFSGCQVFRNPRCTRTTPTYALLRRRVKNSVFWQTPKKKQLLKCRRRARGRTACDARILARVPIITQQIVLSKAMNIDRDAAHPHIRVHPHTRTRTHVHETRHAQGTYT